MTNCPHPFASSLAERANWRGGLTLPASFIQSGRPNRTWLGRAMRNAFGFGRGVTQNGKTADNARQCARCPAARSITSFGGGVSLHTATDSEPGHGVLSLTPIPSKPAPVRTFFGFTETEMLLAKIEARKG